MNPGNLPHGKHAAKNVGVSIVRAGRELELSQSWVAKYDPRERWWGIEIEFPPALDDVFGVSNNKQAARNLTDVADIEVEELFEGMTFHEYMSVLMLEGDPLVQLIEISEAIKNNLNVIRGFVRAQTARAGKAEKRHEAKLAEEHATEVTRERKEAGHSGESDKGEDKPESERITDLEKGLEENGIPSEEARQIATSTIDSGHKYLIEIADLETQAFFSVKIKGGILMITLNTSHPAYEHLVEVVTDIPDEATGDELQQRLKNAKNGLWLLLMAWARYEDEQPIGKLRTQAQDTRVDWGRLARAFLSIEE